jgi:hypothetical protein
MAGSELTILEKSSDVIGDHARQISRPNEVSQTLPVFDS